MTTTVKIWYLTALVFAALALLLAWNALPTYAGDAGCFMPVALNQAAGRGLINDFYPRGDPTGAHRMVWHGFLMPLLYGHLLFKATYPALFVLQGLVAALVVALEAWWLALLVRERRCDWRVTLLGCAALAGVVPFLFNGRPEPFAMALILGSVIAAVSAGARHRWWILGAGLGLLAATQPGVALLAAMLVAAWMSYALPWRQALLTLTACAALALAVTILLATTVFPYGLHDWLAGLRHHGQIVLGGYHDKTTWANRVQAWFWTHDHIMIGVWYLLGAALAVPLLRRAWRRAAWPLGFAAAALAFAAGSWELGIKPTTVYNLIVFAPLLCGLLVVVMADHATAASADQATADASAPAAPTARGRLRAWSLTALVALGMLPTLALVRLLVVAGASRAPTLDYASAKAEFEALHARIPVLAITDVSFSLCEHQQGVQMLFMEDPGIYQRLTTAPVLVVGQDHRPRTEPDEIPGYRLVRDRFAPAPRLLGTRISATPMGYNFAVYERLPEAASAP